MFSHLFWVSTLIPGFAVLQAFFPSDMRRGLLPTVTWSFVLTVALATPIVAVAFAFRLRLPVVAALYFALVLAGLVRIVRFGRWAALRGSIRAACWPDLAIVLCVVALTIPLGGSATKDSFVHAAKIRYLRDVAFTLQDPYSPLPVVESRHHVNVEHALYAIASRVTGEEPLDVWFKSAWFFRLIALGGVGFLAATLFQSRWVGAIAALGALGFIASVNAIVYPYAITAYAVFPVLLAQVLHVVEAPNARRYLRVLASSLALAVLHAGYWVVAAMCLVPAVALWSLRRHGAKRAMTEVLILGALLPGLPFLIITALPPNYVDAQQGMAHLWMLRTIDLGHGWRFSIVDPAQYLWMLPTMAITGLLLAVRSPAKMKQAVLAAVLVTAMACMFTPFLFDALSKVLPYWLVRRARYVAEVIAFTNIAGGFAWLSRAALRSRASRIAFALTVACASLVAFRAGIKSQIEGYRPQLAWLQRARELQETVGPVVPARALVAADPEWSLVLPAVHLSAVMAPELFNANPADGALLQRYRDAQELLASATTLERRREILVQDRVDFVLLGDNRAQGVQDALASLGDLVADSHGFQVFKVRR